MKDKRTYNDRKEYIINAVKKRRKEIRLRAIKHLGGKCSRCGYNKYPEVLEFSPQRSFNKGFQCFQERTLQKLEACSRGNKKM